MACGCPSLPTPSSSHLKLFFDCSVLILARLVDFQSARWRAKGEGNRRILGSTPCSVLDLQNGSTDPQEVGDGREAQFVTVIPGLAPLPLLPSYLS